MFLIEFVLFFIFVVLRFLLRTQAASASIYIVFVVIVVVAADALWATNAKEHKKAESAITEHYLWAPTQKTYIIMIIFNLGRRSPVTLFFLRFLLPFEKQIFIKYFLFAMEIIKC